MRPGHELAMRLRRAYLALHRRAGALLATAGATADQFVLLDALAAPEAGAGVTQRQLSARSGSDANTVAAVVARLEQRGLLRRDPDARDGRARRVRLTPAGRRLHRRLLSASRGLHDRIRDALAPGRRRVVLSALTELTEAMKA
jgi:DNA-binding MarR family transcriptional regulator